MTHQTELKTVTLTVSLSVEVTGKDDKELLEKAKEAFVEKIKTESFPRYSYTIADGEALSADEIKSGSIVYVSALKADGQIFGLNTKTVSFVTKSGSRYNVAPGGLTKSKATIEDVFVARPDWMRKDGHDWEGYNGYLKVEDEYIPVLIGKKKGKTTPAYMINGGGRHYSLSESNLALLLDEIPTNK